MVIGGKDPMVALAEARAHLLMMEVWPRCNRALRALRRAGIVPDPAGVKMPYRESWTPEWATAYAAMLLGEIDDVIRRHIETHTSLVVAKPARPAPKKGGRR